MKKNIGAVVIILIIIIGVVFFLRQKTGYDPLSSNESGDKLHISASIFPIYDIAREVTGEGAEVTLLIPPGASPHTLDLTPEIATKIESADVIFAIGHGLDDFLFHDISKVTLVDKNIPLRANAEEEERGPTDPHYWLSPENGKQIAETIAQALSGLDPESAAIYENRAREYQSRLTAKISDWDTRLNIEGGKAATFHDAFYYFADFFGLEIAGTVEAAPGREPTAKDLARLGEIIKTNRLSTIFTEPQLSGAVISQFAEDNGVKLDVLDPLGGTPGRGSYIDLIEYNLQRIKDGL